MLLPLTQWTLHGENLPERLMDEENKKPSFSLPGADALSAFADLIGEEQTQSAAGADDGAAYCSGGLFEPDISGSVTLKKEIDFSAMEGDHALLAFEQIAGSGEVILCGQTIGRFGEDGVQALRNAYDATGMPCMFCVDVTQALRLGRRETLELRFDDARPAGVCGAAFLRVNARAHLSRVSIQEGSLRRTMTVRARISAHQAGRYVLRAQAIPGEKGAALPEARESDVTLGAGDEKGMQMAMEVSAPAFAPGKAYAAPAIKIQLFYRPEKMQGEGLLCDDALLLCGYGTAAPRAWLPVSEKEASGDPQLLCDKLTKLGVSAVSLSAPAPDRLYRALCRSGIAAVQHVSEEIRPLFTRYPCLTLMDFPLGGEAVSPAAAAWQMMGSVAFPRAIDETLTPQEMLLEAAGRKLDLTSPGVCDTLAWLRAVQLRLRAEAVRQGRYQGALCSAQEPDNDDIRDALKTALAPMHLSALPLSGAWWTGTRFSASLEAFIPEEILRGGAVDALAVLEDEDGQELARAFFPCCRGGYLGVIEYALGDAPCVLTLSCMISRAGDVLEQSSLPVYVGERGPLEAAF